MADLIDRKELYRRIDHQRYLLRHGRNRITVAMVEQQINGMPTVDAELVRHGRWEEGEYAGFVCCSACKDCYIHTDWAYDGKWGFCPN